MRAGCNCKLFVEHLLTISVTNAKGYVACTRRHIQDDFSQRRSGAYCSEDRGVGIQEPGAQSVQTQDVSSSPLHGAFRAFLVCWHGSAAFVVERAFGEGLYGLP